MKTSELTGPALDWAVAKAQGQEGVCRMILQRPMSYIDRPSTNWEHGGPIIEREFIRITEPRFPSTGPWVARKRQDGLPLGVDGCFLAEGPTPLIATMRCYVASKLGDTVDIPAELTEEVKA